jgi:cytochrome c oxidase assembly factor CtaG
MDLFEFTWSIYKGDPILYGLILCSAIVYVRLYFLWFNNKSSYMKFISFFIGLGLVLVLKGSPFTIMDNYSMSLHMLNLSCFLFLVPPFLLLGLPDNIIHGRKGTWTLFILILFSIFLFLYHIPLIQSLLLDHPYNSEVYEWGLFGLALWAWIPLMVPEYWGVSGPLSISYQSLSVMLILPSCLFLVLYPIFSQETSALASMAGICISPETYNHLLPYPFNTKYDFPLSGIGMFFIHKISMKGTKILSSFLSKQTYRLIDGP